MRKIKKKIGVVESEKKMNLTTSCYHKMFGSYFQKALNTIKQKIKKKNIYKYIKKSIYINKNEV